MGSPGPGALRGLGESQAANTHTETAAGPGSAQGPNGASDPPLCTRRARDHRLVQLRDKTWAVGVSRAGGSGLRVRGLVPRPAQHPRPLPLLTARRQAYPPGLSASSLEQMDACHIYIIE